MSVMAVLRDDDCPRCGWPETYAEMMVEGAEQTPEVVAFGCRKCGRLEPKAGEHNYPADMLADRGWTIDKHCYPWVAYRGPRFAPTAWFACRTPEYVPAYGPERNRG